VPAFEFYCGAGGASGSLSEGGAIRSMGGVDTSEAALLTMQAMEAGLPRSADAPAARLWLASASALLAAIAPAGALVGVSEAEQAWADSLTAEMREMLPTGVILSGGLLSAGTPCPDFSGLQTNGPAAGEASGCDHVYTYASAIELLRPRWSLWENVGLAILTLHYCIFAGLLRQQNRQVRCGVRCASQSGAPQKRPRALSWSARAGEPLPQLPPRSHSAPGSPAPLVGALLCEALDGDLPQLAARTTRARAQPAEAAAVGRKGKGKRGRAAAAAGEGVEEAATETAGDAEMAAAAAAAAAHLRYLREPATALQALLRRPRADGARPVLQNFESMVHNEDDVERCSLLGPGEDWMSLMERVARGEQSPTLADGRTSTVPWWLASYPDPRERSNAYGRMHYHRPATTVSASRPGPGNKLGRLFHWLQNRMMTVREMARLQTFPDWVRFFGTVEQAFAQVGNALPWCVGLALAHELNLAAAGWQ